MSFTFSAHSLQQLATVHADLQTLCRNVIEFHDFRIQEGYRNAAAQEAAVRKGTSKLHYPYGKHNQNPSTAVDLYPFLDGKMIGWEEWNQWSYFAGIVMATGFRLYREGIIGHRLRAGIDWNGNHDLDDQSFRDAPHFELVAP